MWDGRKKLLVSILAWPLIAPSASAADLALLTVAQADYHDATEIPSPSASAFSNFMTDEQMVRFGIANPYEPRPHRQLLKVEFSSNTNLRAYALDGYSLMVRAAFC